VLGVDAARPSCLYARVTGGLFRSIDGGIARRSGGEPAQQSKAAVSAYVDERCPTAFE
jgi:hypothetical protein